VNLRELAEADNAIILEDDAVGFGHAITLTPPNTSVAVAAVLAVAVVGVDGTVMPANSRWQAGTQFYRQGAAATIALGVASIVLTAEVAGAAGNLDDGAAVSLVTPIAGITSAAVADTTTTGSDKDPDTVYTVKGQYHRVGVDIDPETGMLVAGYKSAVTVRLSRFPLSALPDNDWLIETTDITGAAVKGKATNVMLDRTAGRVTMLFKR
jgi:hypothetical protein